MDFEQFQMIVADVLNLSLEDISFESTFIDELGADSLDIAQIMMAVEDELGVEVAPSDMDDIVTVGDAFNKIKAACPANE